MPKRLYNGQKPDIPVINAISPNINKITVQAVPTGDAIAINNRMMPIMILIPLSVVPTVFSMVTSLI